MLKLDDTGAIVFSGAMIGSCAAAGRAIASPAAHTQAHTPLEWEKRMSEHNIAIPAVPSGYEEARHAAAFFVRADRGLIVVTGNDRASYLQGMLTNDVAALQAGQGCYATYLTPQGRMISDLYVYELGDLILLSVPRRTKDLLLSRLQQFIFSEDVQLSDATGDFADVAIVGPGSADVACRLLAKEDRAALVSMLAHACRRVLFDDRPAILVRIADVGLPGYELFVDAGEESALVAAVEQSHGAPLGDAARTALRIEGGVPLFGVDMDDETIPLEAGIEDRAISLTKGCYVGQEVIIRVLHRGHGRVAKRLAGIALDGDRVPGAGARIVSGDREVGVVTSSTMSPSLGRPIALGYVGRDFTATGTAVSIDGAAGRIVALPFVGGQTAN
jgi:folate-binding protein YgfZ